MTRVSSFILTVVILQAFSALGIGGVTRERQPQLYLTIDQVMSAQELKDSGVGALSFAQRQVLNAWLNNYTERVLKVTSARAESNRYAGVGSGHWIKEVSSNGAYITLEDGSLWEVNELDRIDTGLWLAVTNITVISSKEPVGQFRYELLNTEDGEKALARYLGSH